eukprot:235631-Chlamydomonas_euryale.AAC.3
MVFKCGVWIPPTIQISRQREDILSLTSHLTSRHRAHGLSSVHHASHISNAQAQPLQPSIPSGSMLRLHHSGLTGLIDCASRVDETGQPHTPHRKDYKQ